MQVFSHAHNGLLWQPNMSCLFSIEGFVCDIARRREDGIEIKWCVHIALAQSSHMESAIKIGFIRNFSAILMSKKIRVFGVLWKYQIIPTRVKITKFDCSFLLQEKLNKHQCVCTVLCKSCQIYDTFNLHLGCIRSNEFLLWITCTTRIFLYKQTHGSHWSQKL